MYLLSIEKYKADGRNEKMIQQDIHGVSFKYVDTSFTFQIIVTCTLTVSVADLEYQ